MYSIIVIAVIAHPQAKHTLLQVKYASGNVSGTVYSICPPNFSFNACNYNDISYTFELVFL